MTTQDDQSKKLKEIQDRLAEIQANSKNPVPSEKTTPPLKEEKITDKEKVTGQIEQTQNSNAPIPKATNKAEESVPVKQAAVSNESNKAPEKKAPAQNIEDASKSWKENKKLSHDIKPSAPIKEAKSSVEKPKGKLISKIFTIISMLITIAIISYLTFAYFNNESNKEKELIISQIPTDSENPELSEEPIKVDDDLQDTEVETAVIEDLSNKTSVEDQDLEIKQPEVVVVKKKSPSKTSERREEPDKTISSNPGIVPAGFIISYASNSQKSTAETNVAQLRLKGFNANFYYMPDKKASSPSLYKVYIGPYNSESAAFPDFKKVVAINDNAFILNMK